jgi:hypothetical protein
VFCGFCTAPPARAKRIAFRNTQACLVPRHCHLLIQASVIQRDARMQSNPLKSSCAWKCMELLALISAGGCCIGTAGCHWHVTGILAWPRRVRPSSLGHVCNIMIDPLADLQASMLYPTIPVHAAAYSDCPVRWERSCMAGRIHNMIFSSGLAECLQGLERKLGLKLFMPFHRLGRWPRGETRSDA